MKISEIKKGDTGIIKLLGNIKIVGVSKKYIRASQIDFSGIIAKIYFKDNSALASTIGFILTSPTA